MTPEEWQEYKDWKEFQEWKAFQGDRKKVQQSVTAVVEPAAAPEPTSPPPSPSPSPEPRPLFASLVTDEVWIEHTSDWEGDAFICWGNTATKTAVGRIRTPGPVLFRICLISSDHRMGFGLALVQKWLNRDVRPKMPPDFGFSP